MWDLIIQTLLGPNVLTGTPPRPPPFEAQRPRWHTAWCPALIPFVTTQAHH